MLIYLDYLLTLWNIVRLFLSLEDAKKAVSLMKNAKTPRSDGLPAEFCKKFFHLFGRDFIDMTNFWTVLTPSQRQYLITLICKDRDFPFSLENLASHFFVECGLQYGVKVSVFASQEGYAFCSRTRPNLCLWPIGRFQIMYSCSVMS